MRIRDYTPLDRPACLEIFSSNVPDFFLPHETATFSSFLDHLPGPYLVIEDSEILGCGGYALEWQYRAASLCWGMVRRDQHRKGLGRLLLVARLAEICLNPHVEFVRLDTSQHTGPFYEQMGFQVESVNHDGYSDGLHQYEMRLELDEAHREIVARLWAEAQFRWFSGAG